MKSITIVLQFLILLFLVLIVLDVLSIKPVNCKNTIKEN